MQSAQDLLGPRSASAFRGLPPEHVPRLFGASWRTTLESCSRSFLFAQCQRWPPRNRGAAPEALPQHIYLDEAVRPAAPAVRLWAGATDIKARLTKINGECGRRREHRTDEAGRPHGCLTAFRWWRKRATRNQRGQPALVAGGRGVAWINGINGPSFASTQPEANGRSER